MCFHLNTVLSAKYLDIAPLCTCIYY